MQNNKPNGTRITVERISVTTIRTRNRWQKIYCDVCQKEIESAGLASPQQMEMEQIETLALPPADTSDLDSK